MKKVNSYKQLGNHEVLVNYIDKLDNDIIKSHNLDIVKLTNKYPDKQFTCKDATSVVISAAVTAYARIYISKLKLAILSKIGNIYYSDTDSLVCDIQLDDTIVDPDCLGKLKLEHVVKKGIFISGKSCCLITKDNKLIKKGKGVKSNSLLYSDYDRLLNNIDISSVIKTSSITDWEIDML